MLEQLGRQALRQARMLKVMTTSGMYGTVADASHDTTIDIEISEGVVTRWLRAAIREKVAETEETVVEDKVDEAEPVEEVRELERRPGALELAWQGDVLLHRELVEEAERLGEQRDLVPGVAAVGWAPEHLDRSGVGCLEPGDDGEQRGLPGTRPSGDGDHLPFGHLEVGPGQRLPGGDVAL